jgi:hypothetical protein
VAVVAPRWGNYHLHDRIQTPVVVTNFFFVIAIMMLTLRYENVPTEFVERPHLFWQDYAYWGITAVSSSKKSRLVNTTE